MIKKHAPYRTEGSGAGSKIPSSRTLRVHYGAGKNPKSKIYGKELILDLYDCDPESVREKKKILEYLNKICKLIKVKKYGRALIERFGGNSNWGEGYSFFQFVEESSISGHFIETENSAYINVFSCKDFDDEKAAAFTKKFFNAKIIKKRTLIR